MRYHNFILLAVFTALLICSPAHAQNNKANDPWAPFQFLLGNWSGVGSGKPGEAVGSCSFSFELGKQIIVRNNRTECPPKPGEKSGILHEDLMIIYSQPADSTFRAIYFDNEGHVINYTVSFLEKKPSVVFESEGNDKTFRFRLVYEMQLDSLLSIEFSVAPPGGEFKTYTKGTVKRSASIAPSQDMKEKAK
jgi:hypothetical protein